MHFSQQLAAFAAAAATLASANSITFVNQDATQRTIVFTPNAGLQQIDSVVVPGMGQLKVNFPDAWIGNAYSVSDGKPNVPGMLAEVTFQGWGGLTYFDVSAIVNPNDHEGVKEMYPVSEMQAKEKVAVSGCDLFPCGKAYYHPDDIQTVTTYEVDFVCTLGNPATQNVVRDAETKLVARKFVLGKF
ncbi:putative DNase1 protein [Rosellinia necatrix]|uniref:Putative DNase1 protein n=1 Tax=Rosellinia necatrix TaxID=77044 RepID=A0A1W2TWT2_ROSNE|nr:putative DNase1 protein [Rosellinia necatrix]